LAIYRPDSRPVWAAADGLPSRHTVLAALRVASVLDPQGSPAVDAAESYWHAATGGTYPPPDLMLGQRLLVDVGLVIEQSGLLLPTEHLVTLLAGDIEDAVADVCSAVLSSTPAEATDTLSLAVSLSSRVLDADRRELLLLAAGKRFDDARAREIGQNGERLVLELLRSELNSLGYPHLARAVRQVSLESDQLGYDISAPRIDGPRRLIEVKATPVDPGDGMTVYLSRNEFETGLKYRDWSLVLVRLTDPEGSQGEVLGWCPASALAPLAPADTASARWEKATFDVLVGGLTFGLPSALL
jgi:Domain of unknown function (DUF3883)